MVNNVQKQVYKRLLQGGVLFLAVVFMGAVSVFAADPTFTQNYFRFYVDNDVLDPIDPWPLGDVDLGENVAITASDLPPANGEIVRLRMTVAIGTDDLSASAQAFKLQFGERTTTCAAIGSWTDVDAPSGSAIWRGYNASPSDGTQLSGNPPTAGDLNISVSDRAGTYEEENNTAVNPHQVDEGEDVEYDFILENNNATASTDYCFRMVEAGGAVFTTYDYYPVVRTSGYRPESQNWRWYDDEQNETPTTALANENVAPIDIQNGNIMKLRVTVNETAGVAGEDTKFKVQFSTKSDFSGGVTDAVEIGSCLSNSLWCYGNGVDADDAAITTLLLTDATAKGTHNESGTSGSTFDPTASTATEYEFTIKHAGARINETYFFRLYDVTNNIPVPLADGESYPSLSTEGGTLVFSVAGIASDTTTEGIVTDVETTATSIPFGELVTDSETEAAQRLTVTTNATQGYQIFAYSRQDFSSNSNDIIDPVAGTNATPSAWSVGCSGNGCFGYHSGDDILSGVNPARFSANDTYAQFTDQPEEIVYNVGPVDNETTDIVVKSKISSLQPAGIYSTQLVYIVVPTF